MSEIFHVLGADPGPSRTGIVLLRLDEKGWPHLASGGHFENRSEELRRLIQHAAMLRAPVGVEMAVTAYDPRSTMAIIETSRVEGRLLERAEMLGTTTFAIEARAWRGELCGSPTASDKQIQIAIETLVRDLPKVGHEARAHLYDACGVALATIARALGRTVAVPAQVMALVHAQRETEKAARGARKAAGLSAVETAKRSPTRAQTARRSAAAKAGWSGRKAT